MLFTWKSSHPQNVLSQYQRTSHIKCHQNPTQVAIWKFSSYVGSMFWLNSPKYGNSEWIYCCLPPWHFQSISFNLKEISQLGISIQNFIKFWSEDWYLWAGLEIFGNFPLICGENLPQLACRNFLIYKISLKSGK